MSFLIVSMVGVVATQILTGAINTRYLFYGRRKDDRLYFSPERVQLLVITIWVAFNYLLNVIDTRTLHDIPSQTLALLGGSHVLYLGGKAIARFAPTPD